MLLENQPRFGATRSSSRAGDLPAVLTVALIGGRQAANGGSRTASATVGPPLQR